MKRSLLCIFSICIFIISGCQANLPAAQNQVTIYSVSGENEDFKLENALIFHTPEQEIFYKGSFYTLNDKYEDSIIDVQYFRSESGVFPPTYHPQDNSKKEIPENNFPYHAPDNEKINFSAGIDLGSLVSKDGYFKESQEHLFLAINIETIEEETLQYHSITLPITVTKLTK